MNCHTDHPSREPQKYYVTNECKGTCISSIDNTQSILQTTPTNYCEFSKYDRYEGSHPSHWSIE